ncbi:glycoside hydrolase family 20 zincin-like fold domain-containing protein [Endozoicomonas sp. NE40]|uniref:beta-N-acetylhexosaminidase n=1 Tax=Endozoicomonas lisbonensis TaxID=3120522 RepID=A0ABV2SB16_9GAMM
MKLNKLAVCCALALPVLYGCNSNDSSDNTVVPPPSVTLEFETIPTVRNWEATEGSYQVTANSRIVINPGNTESTLAGITTNISDTAEKFQETILAVTGLNLTIETSDTLRNGDISLTLLGNENDELGPEGYKLKVGDTVEIEANTNTGLFYGTQTILQLLQQDDEKSRIARGEVTDYPSLTERGIMVDAGRKYWEVDSLKDVIRQMGWMKMNRLHLHLTEWNAFRLDSDNPELEGLAALRAYTREDIAELEAVAKLNHVCDRTGNRYSGTW